MSLPLLASTTPTPTTTNTTFPRVSSKAPRSFNPALISKRSSYTSCKRNQQEGDVVNVEGSVIDRRNVLLGLGGLYSATSTFGNIVVGAPVAPPDLSSCNLATGDQIPGDNKKVKCCLPYRSKPIVDWQLPDQSLPRRIRRPAHKLDSEYVVKYNAAIAEMKKRDKDDPWNFMQQAQIHSAYCNGAYDQVGFPNTPLQVHVRDCLNPANLGYAYQPEDIPWLNIRRKYIKHKKAKKRSAGEGVSLSPVSEFGTSPRLLVDTLRVLIERPKAARSKDEKQEAQEFILVNDIKVDHGKHARFDIYIAKPIEGLVTPDLGEFAGSFVHIPHSHSKGNIENMLRLGITNLVDDIEADSSKKLVVSFVPKHGEVTIGGTSIQFVNVDED